MHEGLSAHGAARVIISVVRILRVLESIGGPPIGPGGLSDILDGGEEMDGCGVEEGGGDTLLREGRDVIL